MKLDNTTLKSKNNNIIISLILFLGFLFLLFIPKDYCTDSIIFTTPLLLVASYLLFSGKQTLSLAYQKNNKKYFVCSFCLSVLSLFILSITALYGESFVPASKKISDFIGISQSLIALVITTLFSLLFITSTTVIIMYLLKIFCNYDNNGTDKSVFVKFGTIKINRFIIPIIIITLFFVANSVWGYGFADATELFRECINNIYMDWHTIGYRLFSGLCYKLLGYGSYTFPVALVQSIIWIFICNYVLNSLYNYFKSYNSCRLFTILLCVAYTPFFYNCIAYKDVIFSMSFLAFSVSIFNYITAKKLTAKHYISIAVFGSMTALFRHFAVVVVVVSLIVIAIVRFVKYKQERKGFFKTIVCVFVPLIVFSGLRIGADCAVDVIENPKYITYTIPIYMTVAVTDSVGSENIDAYTKDTLESIMPIDEWVSNYKKNIYWADTVTRSWGGVGNNVFKYDDEFLTHIMKCNVNLLLSYPKEYLTCFFNINSIIWEIAAPEGNNGYIPGYDAYVKAELTQNTAFAFVKPVTQAIEQSRLTQSISFRGGIWIVAAIFSSIVLIIKKRSICIYTVLPIALYTVSLMVSCPAQDPRYILPCIEIVVFYITVALFIKPKGTE